jgi:hypothetical protein
MVALFYLANTQLLEHPSPARLLALTWRIIQGCSLLELPLERDQSHIENLARENTE